MTGAMLCGSGMVYSSSSTCWVDSDDQPGRVDDTSTSQHSSSYDGGTGWLTYWGYTSSTGTTRKGCREECRGVYGRLCKSVGKVMGVDRTWVRQTQQAQWLQRQSHHQDEDVLQETARMTTVFTSTCWHRIWVVRMGQVDRTQAGQWILGLLCKGGWQTTYLWLGILSGSIWAGRQALTFSATDIQVFTHQAFLLVQFLDSPEILWGHHWIIQQAQPWFGHFGALEFPQSIASFNLRETKTFGASFSTAEISSKQNFSIAETHSEVLCFSKAERDYEKINPLPPHIFPDSESQLAIQTCLWLEGIQTLQAVSDSDTLILKTPVEVAARTLGFALIYSLTVEAPHIFTYSDSYASIMHRDRQCCALTSRHDWHADLVGLSDQEMSRAEPLGVAHLISQPLTTGVATMGPAVLARFTGLDIRNILRDLGIHHPASAVLSAAATHDFFNTWIISLEP
ncbi:hypothetical protein DFH08DRAFT_820903 [Mycena albidolilacea]|uniref:Uncharacterized protein n=1 Tax=Mycena albidolilacea TaxID=1033008 RepID=A0AAD7EDJ6_9AGAR|nr:hypothetical protein DFH08DRAFT_820903 [Mycena albidolilacea]